MGTEVELKFTASPETLRQAMTAGWLKQALSEAPKREHISSIYFDTQSSDLHENGLSLRVRNGETRHLQTIKATSNGPVTRGEWENEIESDQPELKHAKGTALEPLLTKKIRKQLQPVFETSVDRVTMPVKIGESEIELAFDRGQVGTTEKNESICEVEIELKSGNREDLASLARLLIKTGSFGYGSQSKADRGYAILEGKIGAAAAANSISLALNETPANAFAAIGFECLRQIASNEVAVKRLDPEGVHQMRVGVRRLRAAMSFFKEMLRHPETPRLKTELKWLAGELGPARDYHVLLTEGIDPLLSRHQDKSELKVLKAEIVKERNRGSSKAKAAIESERYRNALLETALWVFDGDSLKSNDGLACRFRERPIAEFVEDGITRRSRKIFKKLNRIEDLSPRRRHKLRISVKKLRYACEFFDAPIKACSGKKSANKFKRTLKGVQSALGKLNDITVHAKLAFDYSRPAKATQEAFAMGYMVGAKSMQSKSLLRDAGRTGQQLRKAALF